MELKTQGQLLWKIITEDLNYYDLNGFLLESTEDERKKAERLLVDKDYEQYKDFMRSFRFVNRTEIEMAITEYYERTHERDICMGEMNDIYENVDIYIRENNIELDDDGNIIN